MLPRTEAIYGSAPAFMESLPNMVVRELMFWLYCPISVPGMAGMVLPPTLEVVRPMVSRIRELESRWFESYVYVTAKRLWCEPGSMGQRPGWHSDGFLTDDINYIWYDYAPTEFCRLKPAVSFTADHSIALDQMEEACAGAETFFYPSLWLIRLTQENLHRSPVSFKPGWRTFIKVSISSKIYAHEGNAINHALGLEWNRVPRGGERNCPQTPQRGLSMKDEVG